MGAANVSPSPYHVITLSVSMAVNSSSVADNDDATTVGFGEEYDEYCDYAGMRKWQLIIKYFMRIHETCKKQGWDLIEPVAELGFGDMAWRPRGPGAHFLEILNYLNYQFVMKNHDLNNQMKSK